jgi:two-component system, chemotaxis family, chemotaxis protein CheY
MKKTVLVVDDATVVRKFARRILEDLGFDVEEAQNGKDAADFCGRGMPDGILLDWNMPVMNGIDFLNVLRKMDGGDQPVVLFCTTESELGRIEQAIGGGANEYIMKPFDGDILASKLAFVGLL